MHCIAGNHELLLRGNEGDLHLGVGSRDDGVLAECLVGLVVDLDSEIGEVLAYAATETAIVLADAGGEDDEAL